MPNNYYSAPLNFMDLKMSDVLKPLNLRELKIMGFTVDYNGYPGYSPMLRNGS